MERIRLKRKQGKLERMSKVKQKEMEKGKKDGKIGEKGKMSETDREKKMDVLCLPR